MLVLLRSRGARLLPRRSRLLPLRSRLLPLGSRLLPLGSRLLPRISRSGGLLPRISRSCGFLPRVPRGAGFLPRVPRGAGFLPRVPRGVGFLPRFPRIRCEVVVASAVVVCGRRNQHLFSVASLRFSLQFFVRIRARTLIQKGETLLINLGIKVYRLSLGVVVYN